MDAELMALASTAGTAVVTVLATDVWERAKTSVGALWQGVHPERAEIVEADLLEDRQRLAVLLEADGADGAGGADALQADLAEEWRLRFQRLLALHPDLAQEIRRVVTEELAPAALPQSQRAPVVYNTTATGHSRVYMAGRDQYNVG